MLKSLPIHLMQDGWPEAVKPQVIQDINTADYRAKLSAQGFYKSYVKTKDRTTDHAERH